MTTLSIILLVLLAIVITSSFFMIKNLIYKNETLEDFIAKQSEAIKACDQRLQQVDNKGIFYADDEIGWFFQEVQKIQEALNEFTLK
jgi:peptidoglycan hydrolase CwlO-like protein